MIMSLPVDAATLGAVLGSAVLTFAMVLARTLPQAPGALSWWAPAFAAQTAAFLVLYLAPQTQDAALLFVAEALQSAAGILVLAGVWCFMGRRIGRRSLWIGAAVLVAWPNLALPLHADTAVNPPCYSGFWACRRSSRAALSCLLGAAKANSLTAPRDFCS